MTYAEKELRQALRFANELGLTKIPISIESARYILEKLKNDRVVCAPYISDERVRRRGDTAPEGPFGLLPGGDQVEEDGPESPRAA